MWESVNGMGWDNMGRNGMGWDNMETVNGMCLDGTEWDGMG